MSVNQRRRRTQNEMLADNTPLVDRRRRRKVNEESTVVVLNDSAIEGTKTDKRIIPSNVEEEEASSHESFAHGRDIMQEDSSLSSESQDANSTSMSEDEDIMVGQAETIDEEESFHGTNSLLSVDAICRLVKEKCVCKDCVAVGRGRGRIVVREMSFGLASTLYMTCLDCPVEDKRKTLRAMPPSESRGVEATDKPPLPFGEYAANKNAILLMQDLGIGLEGLRTIVAHLGLSHSVGNYDKWKRLQDLIGEAQTHIADECVTANRKQEITMSTARGIPTRVDDKGISRQGIVVCQDTGWTKRASGHSYSSPNGHYTQVGALSGKIVGYNAYSTLCKTCTIWKNKKTNDGESIPIPKHQCAKNYSGSAKSMEASAAARLTQQLYDDTTSFPSLDLVSARCSAAFVHTTIMDDDSTTEANLKTSLEERLQEQNRARAVDGLPPLKRYQTDWWPTKTNRKGEAKYVESTGKLPTYMIPPEHFWADPSHRAKVLGRHIFAEYKKKESKIGRDIVDRLRRNFAYGIKQGIRQPRHMFRDILRAGFDHEFSIHTNCCESWCRAKGKPLRDTVHAKYWKRSDFPEEYDRLSRVYDNFLSEKRLDEMYHEWTTQKCESLNRAISRTCPKDMVFCQTNQFQNRVAWVVVIDSLGGEEAVLRLYQSVSSQTPWTELMLYYTFKDRRRRFHRAQRHEQPLKKKRKADQKERWKRDNIVNRKGKAESQDYGTGINFESQID